MFKASFRSELNFWLKNYLQKLSCQEVKFEPFLNLRHTHETDSNEIDHEIPKKEFSLEIHSIIPKIHAMTTLELRRAMISIQYCAILIDFLWPLTVLMICLPLPLLERTFQSIMIDTNHIWTISNRAPLLDLRHHSHESERESIYSFQFANCLIFPHIRFGIFERLFFIFSLHFLSDWVM